MFMCKDILIAILATSQYLLLELENGAQCCYGFHCTVEGTPVWRMCEVGSHCMYHCLQSD